MAGAACCVAALGRNVGIEAAVLFVWKIRGQITGLCFVNRGRNNSEMFPEYAAEVR